MEVLVECICGRKFHVDSVQVSEFECESCGRPLTVPPEPTAERLAALRARMAGGEPGLREAMREAAAARDPHFLPLLRHGAESGVREAVNTSLCGMCDLAGPGTDLVATWINDGRLSMSRLASAFRELRYERGTEFLCAMIESGRLKENQIAEVADYLGETGSPRALEALKAARKAFPNLSGILDRALTRLRHLDESAGGVPDEAKRIPGQTGSDQTAQKKGCLGVVVLLALVVAVWVALSGCDDVRRDAFGGLLGTVGYPPLAQCDVDIYDAIQFVNLDSTQGRIVRVRTDNTGRFAIELDEQYLGRPMIVVARPGPAALYRDFGAAGTPDIAFDAPNRPWVAIHSEWLGGEDTVTVNPITTMAFEAIMRLPADEVGGGDLRFDRAVVHSTQAAIAACFGMRAEPVLELPAPPGGPLFAPAGKIYLEDNDRSTSYTWVCLQLAKAANVFVAATPGTDTALDFYDALFRDAEDGVMDGSYFGAPDAFLNQDPAVVGLDSDGASRLFRWLSTIPLDATETGYAGAVRNGAFDTAPSFMLALQADATGAVRPMRIDHIDVWNYPYSGNVELTIRGAGMRRSDVFFFRSFDDSGATFEVNRGSVGVDGQFLHHSASELRLRIPDFGTTTKPVPFNLRVPAGGNFRRVRLELINRPEYEKIARQAVYLLTDNARVTNRTEPLLVHAAIGRVEAAGFTPAKSANNVYPASQDPDALVAGSDEVYELRVRVANPSAFDILGTTLDLAATTLSQLGNTIVADVFSGTAPARAFILPDTPVSEDLSPGEVATLAWRFVFLDTAIPADLAAGAPVTIRPVLTGQSQGPGTPTVTTNDVTDFTRPVTVAPVALDQTAVLASLAMTAPAAAVEGNEVEVDFALTLGSLGGAPIRNLAVESIDLVVTFDSTTTVLRLGDSFFATPGNAGLVFATFQIQPGGGRALPLALTDAAATATLRLTIRTSTGHLGNLNLSATATARDTATGRVSTASDSTTTVITP